jgi:hypothetical protein
MPQPTTQAVHVDVPLTNVSVGYKNEAYIADQIAPLVPVKKQSDIVPQYTQSAWFRDEARKRAPGTKAQGGGWGVDLTMKYFCDRYSYKHEVPDEVRDNSDAPFDQDRDAVDFVTDKIQLSREVKFATDLFTTGVWTSDVAGGTDFTQWSNYGASNPLVNLETYSNSVESLVSRMPSVGVMGKDVWIQLKWHPDLVDLIKYTQKGIATVDLLASATGIPKWLIGSGIYTTTKEGTAEASVTYSRIWGKSVLLAYVPPSPSLMQPAAAYTFVWQRVPNAAQYIKRMRNEEREVDIFEANSYFDQKAIVANAGKFLGTVVA